MVAEIEARLKISAQERTAKAFAAVEARLKKAERIAERVNRQQRQVALFEKTAARTDRALLLGGTAVLGGLAAAGGVRGGLTTLASYEDALIEIAKKGGLTADQMKAIGVEAKALATSGELAVPLDEILASYERAAAAGLPIEEWREFAELSAKAADAFGMTAEEVGNAAAGFKVGLGIPMTEMERYFDLINSLADSGISDESDIIKFLDNAGAGLKNFGLSAKEAAAYGATLLNLKLGPETGARMMNALTSKLIAPENLGKKGQSALKEVVGDIKAFKKELARDPQGAMRKFLGDLSKMDKFKRARVTGAIFGMEWSDEIMRLVDGLEELDRNVEIARGKEWFGSLDKSYQMKLDALSSRWQLFKNQVAELTIDVGEMGMPALEAGLERARKLVKEIGEEVGKFGSQVDQQALKDAEAALGTMITQVQELLNIDASQSQVSQFFRDLAKITSDVAAGIAAVQKGIDFILDPFGTADDKKAEGGPDPKKRSYLGGQFTLEEGSIAAGAIDGIKSAHDWMNWWSAEIRAAAQGLSPPPDPGSTNVPQTATERMIDAEASKPTGAAGGTWLPAPPPETDLPPLTLQIDGVDDTANALREAIQQGGGEISQAGGDAAAAINGAADNLRQAGVDAAASISSARIQMPSMPSGAAAAPARNLGQSMPDAGTTGGG